MKIADTEFFHEFTRLCNDGWQQGWHECNGGNLSYLLNKNELKSIKKYLDPKKWQPLPDGIKIGNITGRHVMLTAAGSHFRDVLEYPKRCTGIIEIDDKGKRFRSCWGFSHGGRPTSELPSHLAALDAANKPKAAKHRVVYHNHPANLIALTFVLPLDEDALSASLTEMISECKFVFPRGLGMLDWMEPGSLELGLASVESLADHDAVIWSHHGLFLTATTFTEAFGLAHTIEKAAEIQVKILSMKDTWASNTSMNNTSSNNRQLILNDKPLISVSVES